MKTIEPPLPNPNPLAVIADKFAPKPTKRQILSAAAEELAREHLAKRDKLFDDQNKLLSKRNKALVRLARKKLKGAETDVSTGWKNDDLIISFKVALDHKDPVVVDICKPYKEAPTIPIKNAADFLRDLLDATQKPQFAVNNPQMSKQLLALGKRILAKNEAAKPAIAI